MDDEAQVSYSSSSCARPRPFIRKEGWPAASGMLFVAVIKEDPLNLFILRVYEGQIYELQGNMDSPILKTVPVMFALNKETQQAVQEQYYGHIACLSEVLLSSAKIYCMWSNLKLALITTPSLPHQEEEDFYKNSLRLWAHVLCVPFSVYSVFVDAAKPFAPWVRWSIDDGESTASLSRPGDSSPVAPMDSSPAAPMDSSPAAPMNSSPAAPMNSSPAAPMDFSPAAPMDFSPAPQIRFEPRDTSQIAQRYGVGSPSTYDIVGQRLPAAINGSMRRLPTAPCARIQRGRRNLVRTDPAVGGTHKNNDQKEATKRSRQKK